MFRTILVPLDGSAFAEHALPWALAVARRAGAVLKVAQVHVPALTLAGMEEIPFQAPLDAQIRDNQQAYLDQVVRRIQQGSKVPVTSVLLDGGVADALGEEATRLAATLVVMTTHGRGALTRLWLGSIADQMIRQASVPVLAVRPQAGPVDLGREPEIRHVLLPLDGSLAAEQMLEPAGTMAALTGASVTLLRIVPLVTPQEEQAVPNPLAGLAQSLLEELAQLQDELLKNAESYLERTAGRLRAQSLVVNPIVVIHDQPAVAILEQAKTLGADVVALATHGRGGLARLALGSIADKVLRGGSLPVLVYRPRGPFLRAERHAPTQAQ